MNAGQTYIAVFPILGPTPLPRLKRQAIDQLTQMIPADVTLAGHDWTWTVRGHHPHAYLIAQRPATGPHHGGPELAASIRTDLPDVAAWLDNLAPVDAAPVHPIRKRGPYRQGPERIAELEHLLAAGEAIEDAVRRCGWTKVSAASRAAYRAGRVGLGNTLEAVAWLSRPCSI